MKGKRKSQKVAEPAHRKPPLWMRLMVAVLSPLLLLGLVEIVLRVAGYGHPSGFFIPWKAAGQKVYLVNEHYCEHFVPKELSRTPEPCVLGRKDDKTIRIFVLGSSAAFGDPEPAYGFCRQLEVLLNEHAQGTRFEVINAAVTAMNSHVARRIAQDCAAHQPDLFIVFMGNNEAVGPYGPPTLPGSLYSSRAFLNACITARKSTRLGTLVSDIGRRLRSGGKPQKKWQGMEAFLAGRITADDPKLKDCYQHFRDNLDDIVRTAQRKGAGVILCTMPTNIASCAPFGSQHKAGLTAEQTAQWTQAFEQGRGLEKAGDLAGALSAYEKARQIDDAHADLAFCMGRCLQGLGKSEEAKGLFIEARDRDVLRFRADSSLLGAIRETAQGWSAQGVRLVDLNALLDSRSGWAMPADSVAAKRPTASTACPANFLVDHVHLDFRGNFLAAMAAMQQIREMMPKAALATPAKSEEQLLDLCRQRLLCDVHERYRMAMDMYRRKTVPPFEGQIDHDGELEALREELYGLRRVERGAKDSEAAYLDALQHRPDDVSLVLRYARFLVESGRPREAMEVYRKACAERPYDMRIRIALAQLTVLGGRKDEAIAIVTSKETPDRFNRKEALIMLGTHCGTMGNIPLATEIYEELGRIDSRNADVLINQAAAASERNDLPTMKRVLDKTLAIDPNSVQALVNMGNYFAKQAQSKEAHGWFAKAIRAEPQNPFAHIGLGIQSVRLDEMDKAVEHLTQAVELKPDFVEAHLLLAAIYQQQGKTAESNRHTEIAALFRSVPPGQ